MRATVLVVAVLLSPIGVLVIAGPGSHQGRANFSFPELRNPAAPPGPAPNVVTIGRSVRGRAINAVEVGRKRGARADLLVVGCIHGNESAGIAVTTHLKRALAGRRLDSWIVDEANPDGCAASTRVNARQVDLNRNFAWRWRHLGRPGDLQYSGRRAFSEPESQAMRRLILRVRPRLAIWFHQPLGIVDESGGKLSIERRFSRLIGLPFQRLTRYPGSAVSWENHAVPGSTAFVVELPAGRLKHWQVSQAVFAVSMIAGR